MSPQIRSDEEVALENVVEGLQERAEKLERQYTEVASERDKLQRNFAVLNRWLDQEYSNAYERFAEAERPGTSSAADGRAQAFLDVSRFINSKPSLTETKDTYRTPGLGIEKRSTRPTPWPEEVDLWRKEGGSPVQVLPSLVFGRHNGEVRRYVPASGEERLILNDKGVAGLLDPDSATDRTERLESMERRLWAAAETFSGQPIELILRPTYRSSAL